MQPLVPPEIDLRSIACMPLDVILLRDSQLARIGNPEAFREWILLLCAAWHEVPASSLPNDDAVLAHYAGLGKDLTKWQSIRDEALLGFVLCDDGRLYHRELAERALEQHAKRIANKKRVEKATATRCAKRTARRSADDGSRHVHRDDDHHGSRLPKAPIAVMENVTRNLAKDVTNDATEVVTKNDVTENVASDFMKDAVDVVAGDVTANRNQRDALKRKVAQESDPNRRAALKVQAAAPVANAWDSWVRIYKKTDGKQWLGLGPPPNDFDCRCPIGILRHYGYA